MGGSFAVVVAALGAAPVNYELSLRTEGRTGTAYLAATSMLSFLEINPAAGLSTRFDALTIDGGYRPRLLYSLNIDHTLSVLHRGNLGGNWRLSRKTRLNFDESLSYGRNDFSPLIAIQGTTPTDPHLPSVLSLAYFSTTSTVGVTSSGAGLEWVGSASYSLSGGLDQAARNVLPLARTGSVSGRVAYEISRSDALTSSAGASVTTFSNGAETAAGSALVGWRRQFTRATQGDVSGGFSLTQYSRPGLPQAVVTGPSASLGVAHQASIFRRQQLRGTARVSYSAAVDPYGGGAYSRAEGVLGADYAPTGWLAFTLRGSGARGLSGPPELRNGLAQLEFASVLSVERHMSISGGVRTAWLSNVGTLPAQPGFQWAAFVGITLRQDGKL